MTLTKKDIEDLGWKFRYTFNHVHRFEMGDVWSNGAYCTFGEHDGNVVIITNDPGFNQDGPNNSVKFNGYVENIDELKQVFKMIRLKIC